MSITRKPGNSPATPLLRTRVVFELTVEQLPLLDQAEARHGSKRAALLAALEAHSRVDELAARITELEHALQTESEQGNATAKASEKEIAKLERDLKAAQTSAAQQAARAAKTTDGAAQLQREIDLLQTTLDNRDDELLELQERAVDELYCARCNLWIDPADWAWMPTDDDGQYAYHEDCGDHGPGILGPSSRLAYRHP